MKPFKLTLIILSVVYISLNIQGCDLLEEKPDSLLAEENLLIEERGLKQVLLGAYNHLNNSTGNKRGEIGITEYCTDILFQHSGGENSTATQFTNFTLTSETGIMFGVLWQPNYRAIRNANTILDNLEVGNLSEQRKTLFRAEARFIRAVAYYKLYRAFGPVPLRTSIEQELELPRASGDEMRQFIESELLEIIPNLPFPGEEEEYGRAHSGAARAFLTKFYLNTHQWEKSANMAQKIIDLGYYSLFPDYPDLFKVENEINREFIWVDQFAATAAVGSNTWITAQFPSGFAKAEPEFFAKPNDEGIEWKDSWRRIASQYPVYDDFVLSFAPEDERAELILVKYINDQGETIDLLAHEQPDARPFKYWPDPNSVGKTHGNDTPVIRYADILLSRAEALNEINGPNQESLDLINMVRNRAGLDDLLLTGFSSKEELRNHLIDERAWEFYVEGLRRFDLIRFGIFIENAQERGISNAQPHHVLYPIPQTAIDANSKLEQNPGY